MLNDMIVQLSSHLTTLNVVLFILLVAEELVGNLPFIQSNSVGQMVISTVKAILLKVWGDKTAK